MRNGIYQIFDTVSCTTIGPIMQASRDAAAIRSFNDVAAAEGSQIHQYPRDFILIKLGFQDSETGAIEAHTPVPIWGGDEYTKQLSTDSAPAANGKSAADASPALFQQLPQPTTEEELEEEFRKRLLEIRQRNTGH